MAVKQQQLLFAELRDTFARRLTNHLNNVFVHQVTGTQILLLFLKEYPFRLDFIDSLHLSVCYSRFAIYILVKLRVFVANLMNNIFIQVSTF